MNRQLLSGTPEDVRRTMEDLARDQDDGSCPAPGSLRGGQGGPERDALVVASHQQPVHVHSLHLSSGRRKILRAAYGGPAARRVRSKSPSAAPDPGTALTERASRGSAQCEHTGTAVTMCPHPVCLVSTGGPPGAAH